MLKVYPKNIRRTSMTLFWYFYCKLWAYCAPFSSASIVDFEQMLAGYFVNLSEFINFFFPEVITRPMVCCCFQGDRSQLVRLNSLKIGKKIWRQSLWGNISFKITSEKRAQFPLHSRNSQGNCFHTKIPVLNLSNMDRLFAKMLIAAIFAKRSISGIWLGSDDASGDPRNILQSIPKRLSWTFQRILRLLQISLLLLKKFKRIN